MPKLNRSRFSRCAAVSLVTLFAAATGVPASAAIMHSDVSIITYADFGQNTGRYTTASNALLNYIRESEGGVCVYYTGGQESYVLEHGLIDFSSTGDNGAFNAIGYNFIATVAHNGVQNPTFTGRYIGESNAIHYATIEYRDSSVFSLSPDYDYKIARTSKLITDVTGATVYSGDVSALSGSLLYRAGAGTMQLADLEGNITGLAGAYAYIIGGILKIDGVGVDSSTTDENGITQDKTGVSYTISDWSSESLEEDPLATAIRGGDSGSPSWVWNEETGQYEYLAAGQAYGGDTLYLKGATEWTVETMESFDASVALTNAVGVITINGVTDTREGETVTGESEGLSSTPTYGTVTDENGTRLAEFVGVKSGLNTWNSLSGLKDTQNWYAYGNEYLNGDISYADLYLTENLVFDAAQAETTINVGADVDLGIGYVEFTAGTLGTAKFTLGSENNYRLNSAGYVVGAGVDLYITLSDTDADYMREWRKIGDGNLHIEGSGNNEIFLNVGGNGATYLNRSGGYAAYNVLANNGATVCIADVNQIARDFTFGYGGALLDMNGNSMEWKLTNTDVSAEGFTINALTEEAIITNLKSGTTVTLTYTESGETTFKGSFIDTDASALKIVADAGTDSVWTLNSIYTHLQNADSGLDVQSGNVVFAGTNTVHGTGSESGTNANRYLNENDWHYADATMNVSVASGATFTLGSHARLTGDVTVAAGGTFVMNEGVKHQYEYIEGGIFTEDTYAISDYYGLKGDVALGDGAEMRVEYSEGTTANTTYAGNITGTGNVSVALGTEGTLTLTGTNTFSGTKTLASGTLVAETTASLGSVDDGETRWLVESAGVIASKDGASLLAYIHSDSSGVFALTQDAEEQLDISAYSKLIIGSLAGHKVNYGKSSSGSYSTLEAYDHDGDASTKDAWVLGGGGGELVVYFRLTGDNNLILGNEYGKGIVTLANADNDFTGTTTLNGQITLSYVDGALGSSTLTLPYSNRVFVGETTLPTLASGAAGVLLLDNWASTSVDISDSRYSAIYLGADGDKTLDSITLADDADYRFGGVTGTLTVNATLADSSTRSRNLMVDGQTFSGGKVLLAQAATLSGNVSIVGYDSAQTDLVEGDITLALGVDEALAKTASVTIGAGGILDLNGTTQHFDARLTTVNGGIITDNSEGKTGTLILSYGDADASLNVGEVGTLRLDSGRFSADSGKAQNVVVNDGGQYHATSGKHSSAFTLAGTGWNASSDAAKQGALRLAGGAEISGSVSLESDASIQVYSSSDSGTLSGALTTGDYSLTKVGAGTLTLSGEVNGNAILSEGALLHSGTFSGTITANGGKLTLSGSSYASGSSIVLNAGTAALSFGGQAFSASLTINDSATANVASNDGINYGGSSSVTVNAGGVLDFGSNRWTLASGNTLTLAGGTVSGAGQASAAGDEYYGALDFIDGGNVVSVTASSVISANVRARGSVDFNVAENASLEISGNLLKSSGSNADFSKSGAGTLNLSGSFAAGATLALNAGATSITSQDFSGNISVASGATLMLAGTFAFSEAVSNAGTVSVDASSILFDLANLTAGSENSYTIISGGTIENWTSLSKENFTVDGVIISARSGFSVSADGIVTIDLGQTAASLIWNPQSGSNLWNVGTSKNWTNDGSADVFYEGDSVTFATADAAVDVAQSLTSGSMTVTENTTFSSSGTSVALSLITDGTISVDSGKTATFDKTLGTSGTFEKIGAGKLVFAADAESVASSVAITEGTFALGVESDSSASFAGTLSGAGVFEKLGAGTLELASANTHSGGTQVCEGTLKIKHKDAFGSGVVSVNAAAVLELAVDMNDTAPAYVLNGGTLAASVATGSGSKQIASGNAITLTADSTIRADASFGMISGNYAANTLDLGGNTLTKTGTASFFLANTTVTAGTLRIEAGTLEVANQGINDASAADFVLEGGTLHAYGTFYANSVSGDSGTFKVSGGATTVSGNSDFSGTISQTGGTLTFSGDATLATISQTGGTLNISGDANSSVAITTLNSAGTLNISGVSMALAGTNNLYGTTTVSAGAVLDLTANSFASGGSGYLVIDNAKVKISSMAWGSSGNFGTAMWNDRMQLKNGAVLEITAPQEESTGGHRGFAVAEGAGTYLYSGTGTSYVSANEVAQSVHLADGATLTWDVADADATLVVDKIIGLGLNTSSMAGTTGSVVKTGAGTLTLSAENLFSGGISVEAGTLNASGSALGRGGISVSENATLALSGDSVSLYSTIQNAGTVSIADGTIFNLDNLMPDGRTYIIISGAGTVEGWDALTLGNFTHSTEANLQFSADGSYSLCVSCGTLTWAGDASGAGTWDIKTSANWTYESGDSVRASGFYNEDEILFDTAGAQVTLADGITVEPGAMTVNADVSFSGAGTIAVANADLSLADGVSIRLAEDTTLDLGSEANGTLDKNITGAGTLAWGNSGTSHDITIALSDDFSGTLRLSGNIDANALAESNLGGTQKIVADGVWLWNDGVAAINLDVLLTDSSPADSRASGNLYQDGGGVSFNGNFRASGKTVKLTAGTNTFAGETVEIGTLNVSGGTLNLAATGTATIDSLNVSGGSITVSGGTNTILYADQTAGTLTLSGGTLILGSDDFSGDTAGSIYLSETDKSLSGNLTLKGGAKAIVASGADDLNYDGDNTITVATGGELYFNSARWTVGTGNKIVLCGGKITGTGQENYGSLDFYGDNALAANGGVDSTIEAPIRLRGNLTIAVGDDSDSASSLAISGLINQHETHSITKTGAGTLTLSAENTYSGGTTISGGKVVAENASAFGTGTLENNSALELNFDGEMSNVVSGTGTLTVTGGNVTLSATNTYTGNTTISGGKVVAENASAFGTGTLENNSALELNFDGEMSNVVSGAGTLTVTGGNVTLSATNTYTGNTTVDAGTLKITDKSALGSLTNTVTVNSGASLEIAADVSEAERKYVLAGGTLKVTTYTNEQHKQIAKGDDTISLTADSTIQADASFGMISAGYDANQLNLGGNTLTKTGAATFYLGRTTVTAGTLRIEEGSIQCFSNGGNCDASAADVVLVGGSGKLNISTTTLGVKTLTVEVSDSYTEATLSGTGTLNIGDGKVVVKRAETAALDVAAGTAYSYQIAASDANFDASWTESSFRLEGWETGWYVESYDTASGLLTIAIPEPSLFGLLSGLGALFLVGTRRRKRA